MPYSDGSGNGLSHNEGFTLPANIGELGDDITELDLRHCSLKGARVESGLSGFICC